MSDSPEARVHAVNTENENASYFGRGGRLYREEGDPEPDPGDMLGEPPAYADAPEPKLVGPPKIEVKAPPAPPRDWGQLVSTLLELAGMSVLCAGAFVIAVWLGLITTGICLIVLGVAMGLR